LLKRLDTSAGRLICVDDEVSYRHCCLPSAMRRVEAWMTEVKGVSKKSLGDDGSMDLSLSSARDQSTLGQLFGHASV
jgi:hypothetical protein